MRRFVILDLCLLCGCGGAPPASDLGGDSSIALDCDANCCPPCAPGVNCRVNADCQSGLCAMGICQAPTCTDGVRNGDESDVDCGGSCPACSPGEMCTRPSDCNSGLCGDGGCLADPCANGRRDENETDVDCGGDTCPRCADGKSCNVGKDCLSGICTGRVCQPRCAPGTGNCDGIAENGCETDLQSDPKDCGQCGMVCPKNGPCAKGICTMVGGQVSFHGTFTNGQSAKQACADWMSFRGQLMGLFTRVTITGSLDAVGVSCGGNNASTLCNALRAGIATTLFCDGRAWSVSSCGGDVELSATAANCHCDNPGYSVRPCDGADWGGVASATCNPPSQTIQVTCE